MITPGWGASWALGVPSGRGSSFPEQKPRCPLLWEEPPKREMPGSQSSPPRRVVTGGTEAGETSQPFSVSQASGRRPWPRGISDSAAD